MKNLKTLILILIASYSFGQVAIGKTNVNGSATILDFDDIAVNYKGIILPAIDAVSTLTFDNNGTFLFDKSDNKVKMYENNTWVSLSNTGDSSVVLANNTLEAGDGVIIGSKTTAAKGILVLESANKAMILPKISNPHTTVKSPYPGMICYDTASKTIAVFDGSNWNYWK